VLVSVIIPTLNEAREIELTLASVRRDYSPEAVEIIVVDGGSTDGTREKIAPPAQVLTTSPGRSLQMNCGAKVSRGEILLFCHADTRLPPGWREAIITALENPKVSGGTFNIRFHPPRGILHILNILPVPPDWRLMYGDQGQFTRRHTFEMIGGFPDLPIMEDLELMRRLKKTGKLVRVREEVISSSRRFLEKGPLKMLCLDIWYVLSYLYFGSSAADIARKYDGHSQNVLDA
jgi:rSAM/selenodomain-associated transferase 2